MSGLICALALRSGLPNSQKLVMLALGDQANDYGEECFPGLELIMQLSSLSRRTVFTVLAELEVEGYITRQPFGVQRVSYTIHVDRLRQSELPLPTQRTRNVPRPDQCESRTGAKYAPVQIVSKTGANFALHKSTHKSTQVYISGRACEGAQAGAGTGQFEGHPVAATAQCSTANATPAGLAAVALRQRGFAITSAHPDLLEAQAEGVTLDQLLEFAEVYPAAHPKCRGSPGYVIGAARRQRQSPPGDVSGSPPHASRRKSAAERVLSKACAAEERDAAAGARAAAGPPAQDLLDADG